MAEKLRRTQPTSSIAAALNLDAVRAFALQPTPVVALPSPARGPAQYGRSSQASQSLASGEPTGESASVMRQVQLTPTADATLKALMDAYGRATGLELTRSEFLRAALHALAPTVQIHERAAAGIGRLRRAKNEARLFHKRDELERRIAGAFTAAMRAAPNFE